MQPVSNNYNYNSPMNVRYAVPTGYRPQNAPPFANLSFDRYANIATGVQPPVNPIRPAYYPTQATGMRMPNGATLMGPNPSAMNRPPEKLQPPEPYYYNPNPNGPSLTSPTPSSTTTSKKGAKEYKETAFTIKPDGAEGEAIRGLVSNDDINKLLTHKGTKVKVAKIYRITKTNSNPVAMDSDDDLPPLPPLEKTPQATALPTPVPAPVPAPASVRRSPPSRSPSLSSSCSSCSCSSCSSCRSYRRPHSYDDCPECIAERRRRRRRHRRRR